MLCFRQQTTSNLGLSAFQVEVPTWLTQTLICVLTYLHMPLWFYTLVVNSYKHICALPTLILFLSGLALIHHRRIILLDFNNLGPQKVQLPCEVAKNHPGSYNLMMGEPFQAHKNMGQISGGSTRHASKSQSSWSLGSRQICSQQVLDVSITSAATLGRHALPAGEQLQNVKHCFGFEPSGWVPQTQRLKELKPEVEIRFSSLTRPFWCVSRSRADPLLLLIGQAPPTYWCSSDFCTFSLAIPDFVGLLIASPQNGSTKVPMIDNTPLPLSRPTWIPYWLPNLHCPNGNVG